MWNFPKMEILIDLVVLLKKWPQYFIKYIYFFLFFRWKRDNCCNQLPPSGQSNTSFMYS